MRKPVNNGKKIVVTGGAGFIGSHIAEELVKRGYRVTVVDDLSSGKEKNIPHLRNGIEFMKGDINDLALMDKACKGAYAVIHQAAVASVPKSLAMPIETHRANVTGTLSVMEAAKRNSVDRVIYASSSAVYGDSAVSPKKESMEPRPISPYGAHKLMDELYGRLYNDSFGLKTIGLRYFNVFGPCQDPSSEYAAVIPRFISTMKSGKRPTIFGDGSQTRDFTFVADVVGANLAALSADRGFGKAFNIGSGSATSLNGLVAEINSALDSSIEPIYGDPREGDIKDSCADISLARSVLGFKPAVDLKKGLKITAESL